MVYDSICVSVPATVSAPDCISFNKIFGKTSMVSNCSFNLNFYLRTNGICIIISLFIL